MKVQGQHQMISPGTQVARPLSVQMWEEQWQRWMVYLGLQLGLLVGVILFALSVGVAEIHFMDTLKILLSRVFPLEKGWEPTSAMVILQVRFPRIMLASLVGGALAIAGVIFQALLQNPLAEPYILGVSGGAAVGTILALMLGLSQPVFGISPLPIAATTGATLTIYLVYRIALREGYLFPYTLLLAGVIVSSFLTALIMLLTAVASLDQTKGIIFWLMGDLGSAEYRLLSFAALYMLLGMLLLYLQAGRLNILTLGEETGLQLGIEVEKMKLLFFLLASLITGAAVSLSGVIGFVGLIVPHAMRMLAGPDHRILIPAAGLMGATFLILCDTIARTILSPAEIPVGVVTAMFGAPFFIYLLRTRGGK